MLRKFKVFTILLLATVFLFSFIGCGQTDLDPSTGETGATTATATATAGSESAPAASAPEKVTITILTEMNAGITVPGVQEDQVAKKIEEDTGITMNIENVEGANIVPKISAMMASGDLPDLFCYDDDKPTRQTLIESGSAMDLTDLATTKLTNWTSNERLKYILEFSKKYLSGGTGKLYNIPVNNGPNASPAELTVGAFVRWDYYKELGYPKVSDIMDLLPILKSMVDSHPKTVDGKTTYGVGFWTDWDIWPVSVFGFIDGYAEGNNFGTIDISNEKYVSILDDSSIFWKYTRFYNKAYQMGILDPDSFTMKETDWEAKVTAGQEYFFINGWLQKAWKGEAGQGYAPVDTTGNSDKSYTIWGSDIGVSYMVSAKSKVADRVLDFINYLAQDDTIKMLTNGVKGQVWDDTNGKSQFIMDVYNVVSDSNNAAGTKYGFKKYDKLSPIAAGVKDAGGNYYDFRFDPEFVALNLSDIEKDCATFYGFTLPSDMYTKKTYTQYGNLLTNAMPDISDQSYEQKYTNMNKYVAENWITLINAKDDAAYDAAKAKFTQDMKDMGWDEVMSKYMDQYNKTKAELDSIK